ncbi:hypothetical protein FOTG_16535 [Fusarium oxysporum f. sp. vasinfectum 25433]|uniref:Uncharacterized protein n=1 Tax=Fusarium oxysporum f. sp. vasinfectum 25433 TaxID=1089449 RepID=X0L2A6_FUSOX|nr:hypothetical protein FOTG_16535 [Fusarium oxysporum f. sp. vasinfectum 25433]
MNTPSSLRAESDKFINTLQRLASLHKLAKGSVVSLRFVRSLQQYDHVGWTRCEVACLVDFVSPSSKFVAEIPDEIHDFDILQIWQANWWLKNEFLDAAGNGYVKALHYDINAIKSPMTL